MKKMMKLLTVVAAAAMGLTACQSSFEETVDANVNVKNSVIVNFVAETTKTAVDTSGDTPIFSWDESETFAVLEQTDALAKASSVVYTNVDGKADIKAEFALNAGHSEYKYVAVYPEAGFKSAENINAAVLALPASQSAVEGSYDPNADLMVSMPVVTTAQPTEAQPMRFTRLAAVAKMTINNLNLAADEVVECVEFTANGKNLAGTIIADLEDPHANAFTVEAGVSTVSVATTSATEVYFTVLPTLLEAEDAYSVVVVTNKQVYIKQGAIPEGKSLEFVAGKVSRFPVDMTEALVGAKWKLVRDASTLKGGDVVTFVAKNYNYVVGKQTMTAAPIASQTEVVKAGNYLYHKPADATSLDHMLQSYTLMQRDESRVAFDFYNGVDYEDDEVSGFLWATGISGSPKLQAFCDKNTLFYIDITDGTALVEAKDIEKTYKYIRYYHSNYSASSRKFECTSSSPTGNYQICLYRLEGEKREIPPIDAHVTVPSSTTSIVITDDGVVEPTVIEEVVFNYVGDWKISVEDNKEWLNVVYDAENNCLKYTAEKNADPKRDAVVTITASLEGQESLTWTFNMVQKGAPVEYSIEDFGKLAKDENSTYKLTGKVTAVAGKTSEAYVLSDENGNTANIKYLYTEDEASVWGHDDFTIQLGDVMTVVTVPMGSANGGSSAYHSYYKGHYRLTATAGVAADYTGGTVAIEVATSHNGNIVLPTTPVSGTMAPCDYATFAYTDGAASATVTFTSVNETSYAREATATFTYGLTSVEVTVQQGINPANKIGWELVTDASTLAVGNEVIIVTKNGNYALACPTKTSDTKLPSTTITKTGNVIYDIEEAGVQPFKLVAGASDGTMALEFSYKDTTYYPYYSSGIKLRTSVNAAASWTIAIDSEGDASISNSSSSSYLIKFNSATAVFTCYKDSTTNATKAENLVSIYKKQVK